jgi:hypothetical protein
MVLGRLKQTIMYPCTEPPLAVSTPEILALRSLSAHSRSDGGSGPEESGGRSRILKQHRESYISDKELHMNIAAVDLALASLAVPEADGVRLDTIIEAGGRLPDIAALWNIASPEERRKPALARFSSHGAS